MKNIINLTPHVVNVYDETKNLIASFKPDGAVARVELKKDYYGILSSDLPVPVYYANKQDVVGLPEYDSTLPTLFIVSAMVREALPNRLDLLSPGELLRDEAGQPIGCVGFFCN